LIALPAVTTNNTQNDWTAPDLPDDCSSALEIYYCSPSSDATVPPSSVPHHVLPGLLDWPAVVDGGGTDHHDHRRPPGSDAIRGTV